MKLNQDTLRQSRFIAVLHQETTLTHSFFEKQSQATEQQLNNS